MTDEEVLAKRKMIQGVISDTVGRFLYYDRKEDEDLSPGVIEGMIDAGLLTTNELVEWMTLALRKGLGR